MKSTLLISLLAISLLSGCSTINFEKEQKNDVKVSDEVTYSSWHHNAIFSLFEVTT